MPAVNGCRKLDYTVLIVVNAVARPGGIHKPKK
jgi:hypothetical protein